MTRFARAGFAIAAEGVLQFAEHIRFRAEMAQVVVSASLFRCNRLFHLGAVVAMERIALNGYGVDVFAPENLLERMLYGCRAGAGRARHGNDWMLLRHRSAPYCTE